MTSCSNCFFVVSMLLVLQFLSIPVPALASTKYIDGLCQMSSVIDKTYCRKTLTAYPPAVSATDAFSLAQIVIRYGMSEAKKIGDFAAQEAKTGQPSLKRTFESCNEQYVKLVNSLQGVLSYLKKDPEDANYVVKCCYDITNMVKYLLEKKTDKVSKKIMEMTLQYNNFLVLLVAATETIGG